MCLPPATKQFENRAPQRAPKWSTPGLSTSAQVLAFMVTQSHQGSWQELAHPQGALTSCSLL